MAKKAYFWGIVLMLLSVVQGQAAQCPARQIDLARQFAADPASGNNARLICDQRFVRATDPASAEAERTACLLAAETVFIPAYDNVVAGGSDCQLTRPGQEISRVWGGEIDQAVAPLLAAWAQSVPTGPFTPASRNRRFASIVRAIGFATNQAFRAEAAFIRNDLTAQERDQRRVNTTRKLTRRLGNLTRNRPDYNGPTVETLVRLANQAVDRIVAMALANPGIPAPTSVVIQDGGDGVDLAEANAGVAVTVGLADDLWPGVQLNLSWGDQPPMTVGLTAADLAAASKTVVVPFATIQTQGDGPVTVSARLSHPAGATSLTLKSGTTVNVSGVPLTVRVVGSGTVTSSPPGIDCGPDSTCSAPFPSNSMVDLQARPQEGWTFTGWQGDCAGTGACRVTMNRARSVVANFAQAPSRLTIEVRGSGSVSSAPVNGSTVHIECFPNQTCSTDFPPGTRVTLTAMPESGANFAGWSGDCSGTGPCTVTLDRARSVRAQFSFGLVVEIFGPGRVVSNPPGIDCLSDTGTFPGGATCSATFPFGSAATLVPIATDLDFPFYGWNGDCAGQGMTCILIMDGYKGAIAYFYYP